MRENRRMVGIGALVVLAATIAALAAVAGATPSEPARRPPAGPPHVAVEAAPERGAASSRGDGASPTADAAEGATRARGDRDRGLCRGLGRSCARQARPRPCAEPSSVGGDWTSLNGDLHNTRNQPSETLIGVDEAPSLRPAWSFAAGSVGATGGMRSTPVVSGGCVFVAFGQGYLGDRGDVVALDADTGRLVWHTRIDGSVLGLAVDGGLVYVTPSKGTRGEVPLPVVNDSYQPAGSFVVALDASTGAVRWESARLDDGNPDNGTFVNASPVVFESGGRRMVFVPLAGGSGDGARIPMYFLDAGTGETIRKAYALTTEEYDAGFGGTGIWSTAAFHARTGHLYAGTADSDGHRRQHPYNNALLRIDADPTRATFASVVGSYAGTSEHGDLDEHAGYDSDLNPLCGAIGEESPVAPPTFFDTSASAECLELDLDFGASPNLSTDPDGRLTVSALQKSGVFHAVAAETMEREWTFVVGPGGAAMDSATAALSGGSIYVGGTPNVVFSLDRPDGGLRWASTTGVDAFAYQPLTVANGVLYGINDVGMLSGLDAEAGMTILHRSIATDGGFSNCLGAGAGVAVARNTVFAPCDAGGTVDLLGVPSAPGGVVAYRLP